MSLEHAQNIAVFGTSGAIGTAFVELLQQKHPKATIHSISRTSTNFKQEHTHNHVCDYYDETALKELVSTITQEQPLDMVLVTTGILHDESVMPEKSLSQISAEKMLHLFTVNTVVPTLIAKYCVPKLHKKQRSVFMALSARIGSISDNGMGGWHSYRASKAALNMLIKNISIETARRNKEAVIIGMHPGTVDSKLSKPFQKNIPAEKLFTADFSVEKLYSVLDALQVNDTGKCFGWAGDEILP